MILAYANFSCSPPQVLSNHFMRHRMKSLPIHISYNLVLQISLLLKDFWLSTFDSLLPMLSWTWPFLELDSNSVSPHSAVYGHPCAHEQLSSHQCSQCSWHRQNCFWKTFWEPEHLLFLVVERKPQLGMDAAPASGHINNILQYLGG